MTSAADDWRLQGQERYLQGISLEKKKYTPYRTDWAHDHCEFCWTKFSSDPARGETEGYTTTDHYRWICGKCFEDFKEKFAWKILVEEPVQA